MTNPDKDSVERLIQDLRNCASQFPNDAADALEALQARVDALTVERDTALKERDEARATILEQDEELAILRPMELIVKDLAQGPQLGSVIYRWMDDLIRRAKSAPPQKLRHDSPAKSLIKDVFKG